MKLKIQIIFFSVFFSINSFAENMLIQAKNISLDKDGKTSVFTNEVVIETKEKIIKSNYVKYNKETGYLLIKDNVVATDKKQNTVITEYAEYFENEKIFKSKGFTKVITSENYVLEGSDVFIDNNKKIITSKKSSKLIDQDKNKIYLENFEYLIEKNIFKSIGNVKIIDNNNNNFEFSQIYINTNKKEILGTDLKAYLNDPNLKVNEENKPRIFSNNIKLNKDVNIFNKGVFTLCGYRKDDKCPPWSIQSSKILHDNKEKTIYYDNALIKVYNIPIFYSPKFSHPDPSVKRRSGLLPPSITSSKNLGEGISIPYFFDLAKNKNFTLTNQVYGSENPLFYGEYHHALKDSFLMADFGFTEGYKKTSSTKLAGGKSHFFAQYVKNFKTNNNADNNFNLQIQDISNDKYLKLYKIKSNLVDYNVDTLESSLNFTRQTEDNFFGLDAVMYERIKEGSEDKYEYILPELTFDKNLLNHEKFGSLELQTNLKIRNYDTNKLENFLVNNFNWESKNIFFDSGINTKILGNLKNINYEAKNVDVYKKDPTSEVYGALGFLSEINLQKKLGVAEHFLTPKVLFKFAPGSMRKENSGNRLDPINAFSLNRVNNINNYESGLSGTLGFDYKIKNSRNDLDFSIAQVINEKENKKIADITSMNEKLSDLVGSIKYNVSENTNLKYDFAIDQNYSDVNYNEISTSTKLGALNLNFGYLQENKHIGDQEYFTTKLDFNNTNNGVLSFGTKRNLITNSAEFYNLSYEYFNDCLRAGLVYRREFYNDSELEPENSLMFKITLAPFGDVNSPKINN